MTEDRRLEGKYLSVLLDREGYALSVMDVREIVRLAHITPVARTPEHVRGVMNLRGRVFPVIDLRTLFGLRDAVTDRTCVVVVGKARAGEPERPLGLIVDAVEDVGFIAGQDIDPAGHFAGHFAPGCLLGMAKTRGGVRMLLDIQRIDSVDTAGAAA